MRNFLYDDVFKGTNLLFSFQNERREGIEIAVDENFGSLCLSLPFFISPRVVLSVTDGLLNTRIVEKIIIMKAVVIIVE